MSAAAASDGLDKLLEASGQDGFNILGIGADEMYIMHANEPGNPETIFTSYRLSAAGEVTDQSMSGMP